MIKAEDVTVRVAIPRLRPGVVDDSVEHQIPMPPAPEEEPRDEDDTRRIRRVARTIAS